MSMNKKKEWEERKNRVVRALVGDETKPLQSKYSLDFIVECLMDWERDKNYTRVSKKYNINVKTITNWAERLQAFYQAQYQKKASEIQEFNKPVSSKELKEAEYALQHAREQNIRRLGGTLEAIEHNLYDMAASALYDSINDIQGNFDQLTESQKIQFMNTLLKMKGDSVKVAKELNRRLYKYYTGKLGWFCLILTNNVKEKKIYVDILL